MFKNLYVLTTSLNFSFKCGIEYHAPTDCEVIKKWLTKCADDSETANYISANTKDVSNLMIVVRESQNWQGFSYPFCASFLKQATLFPMKNFCHFSQLQESINSKTFANETEKTNMFRFFTIV